MPLLFLGFDHPTFWEKWTREDVKEFRQKRNIQMKNAYTRSTQDSRSWILTVSGEAAQTLESKKSPAIKPNRHRIIICSPKKPKQKNLTNQTALLPLFFSHWNAIFFSRKVLPFSRNVFKTLHTPYIIVPLYINPPFDILSLSLSLPLSLHPTLVASEGMWLLGKDFWKHNPKLQSNLMQPCFAREHKAALCEYIYCILLHDPCNVTDKYGSLVRLGYSTEKHQLSWAWDIEIVVNLP